LIEVVSQDLLDHVPRAVCAEESLDVVGIQDAESLIKELHHFNPQDVEIAVRSKLQIVAQIESRAPHGCDRAERRIVGTFANDLGHTLVAPVDRYLPDEERKQFMKARVGPCARRRRSDAVTKRAAIRSQTIAAREAQHLPAIKLVETVGTWTRRKPHGAGAEQLLQFAHRTKHTDALVLVDVIEISHRL